MFISARKPSSWVNPIPAKVEHSFNSRNDSELSIRSGQTILVAPKEIQQTHNLLNCGWALATVNRETSGIVPINHIQQVRTQIVDIPPPVVDNSAGVGEPSQITTTDA